jgi:hypothetical protein
MKQKPESIKDKMKRFRRVAKTDSACGTFTTCDEILLAKDALHIIKLKDKEIKDQNYTIEIMRMRNKELTEDAKYFYQELSTLNKI